MARRKKHEEHENHERWLVSYADFITLLFAFFVVMYSISSVNEGKYRVLSDSLMAAFRSSARTLTPIQVGQLARSPRNPQPAIVEEPRQSPPRPIIDLDQYPIDVPPGFQPITRRPLEQAAAEIDYLADDVEASLEVLIDEGLVSVRRNRLWLEVEINTSILFSTASADPSVDAELVLRRLARLLSDYSNPVHVEGFTDDRPIQNSIYPSNWELSSARAAAVVRLFSRYGIDPSRMVSVGYGEHKPAADNDTELGRARNRRVVVVIIANIEGQRETPSPGELELMGRDARG